MWFPNGPVEKKSSIEEANKHLSALMSKIEELESLLGSKENELKEKDAYLETWMEEVREKRDSEIRANSEKLFQQNLRIDRLERDLANKESELVILRQRARMLDEILRYKATLAKLTITMEQAEQYSNISSGRQKGLNHQLALGVNTDPAPLPPASSFIPMDPVHQPF